MPTQLRLFKNDTVKDRRVAGDPDKDAEFRLGLKEMYEVFKKYEENFSKYRFFDNQTLESLDNNMVKVKELRNFYTQLMDKVFTARVVKAKQSSGGRKGNHIRHV